MLKFATIILVSFDTRKSYVIPYEEKSGATLGDVLDYLFRQTNVVDGTEYISQNNIPVRSSSVGDLFVVDGCYYLVDNMGFIKLDTATAILWQSEEISKLEASMGWEWARKTAGDKFKDVIWSVV